MRNKIKALVVKNSNKGDNNNYTNDDTLMSIYTDSLIGNMKVTPKILSMYSGHFILCWLMLPFIVRFLNIYIYIYTRSTTHRVLYGSNVPKCMSCHKAIVVITRRAHCFHDCI